LKTNEFIGILVDGNGDPKACYYDGHDDGVILITNDDKVWDRITKNTSQNY